MFSCDLFENHWVVLLREFTKRRQRETQISTTHKVFTKTHIVQQTKQSLQQNIIQHVEYWISRRQIRALNDENKLHVDKKNNNK